MEKLVDLVAPRTVKDLFLKAAILVSCFTAFDHLIANLTNSFTDKYVLGSLFITFLIGAPFGLFVMAIMTTQRKLKERMKRIAETDMLTGLPNRNAFLRARPAH